jgi:hypothetical protein
VCHGVLCMGDRHGLRVLRLIGYYIRGFELNGLGIMGLVGQLLMSQLGFKG